MKKTGIPGMLISLCFLTACVSGDFDHPPFVEPKSDLIPTHSIAELLDTYDVDFSKITDSIIIGGVVTGNDISGNLYKKFIVQDSSAAIDIEVDMSNNFKYVAIGQKVLIKCQGLAIGKYAGLPQLGSGETGSIGRMSETMMYQHVEKNGYPLTSNLPEPIVLTIAEIKSSGNLYINRLIQINNLYFAEGGSGLSFAEVDKTTNRIIWSASADMLVRTSNYATFAALPLPEGLGSLRGILGIFSTDYQLSLRDRNDILFDQQ